MFLDVPSMVLHELSISVVSITTDALQSISDGMESATSFTVLQSRVLDALCRSNAKPRVSRSDARKQVATDHEYPSSRL